MDTTEADLITVEDLPRSLATLIHHVDLACIAESDDQIDHGIVLHLQEYVHKDLGVDDPESASWVEAAIRANHGPWTAWLCRAMHDLGEDVQSIAHCGLCQEYANPAKRERAAQLPPRTLPGFEEIGGAYQLHPRCGRHGLTWLRKLIYRRRDQGRWESRREKIPDCRQARGWDWASRIYKRN